MSSTTTASAGSVARRSRISTSIGVGDRVEIGESGGVVEHDLRERRTVDAAVAGDHAATKSATMAGWAPAGLGDEAAEAVAVDHVPHAAGGEHPGHGGLAGSDAPGEAHDEHGRDPSHRHPSSVGILAQFWPGPGVRSHARAWPEPGHRGVGGVAHRAGAGDDRGAPSDEGCGGGAMKPHGTKVER